MRRILVKEKHLIEKFKMQDRTIRSYFSEARVAPGTYDLMECIDIYVEKTLNKNSGEEIKVIEKNTKKLKLEILEGKYHKVEDVKRIVLDMLSNFKSKLTVLPIKLGQDLLGEDLITNKNRLAIQENIKLSLDEALKELSEYEYKEQNLEGDLD